MAYYHPQGWWPLLRRQSENWHSVYQPADSFRPKTQAERFQIAIGAILTQNTNWQNAEKALINLQQKQLLQPDALLQLSEEDLAPLIRPSGYFRQKAKAILAFSKSDWLQTVPSRERLLQIWGIGPETADDILLYALNLPSFVVDTFTKRLFHRLALAPPNISYDQLKARIEDGLPEDPALYNEFHALIVAHAKRFCRKTPLCSAACPLRDICPHPSPSLKKRESGDAP